jgi:phospholipid/cholesterol/gamma-HCH transport system substrate-binding protein
MGSIRERALVGLFVLVAVAVLLATVFTMSGTFDRTTKTYHAYFPFAGGIESGSTVRYSGGPKIGHVENLHIDAGNPSRFDITFSVQSDLPVKTDSHVKIMSMNPLGDNHLEIIPGTPEAAVAPDRSLLPSESYLDFNALAAQINYLAPEAQQLLRSLNDRATEVKETVERVNDLLNAQNRANLAGTLANARGMIEENRPNVKSTLQQVNDVSAKLDPLLENFRTTSNEANLALSHIDSTIGENRDDVRQAVIELRRTLANMTDVTARLDQTLDVNSENIDELLDNLRHVTENLSEFTATIKTRPYTLIRATNPREHKAGEAQ